MGIFSKLFKIKKATPSDIKIKDDKVEVKTEGKSVTTETRYEPEVTATVDPISGYVPPMGVEKANNTTTEDKKVDEIKLDKEASDAVKATKPKTTKKSTGTKKATTTKKSTDSSKSTAKKASTTTKKSTSSSKAKTTTKKASSGTKSTSTKSKAKTKLAEDK